MRWQWLVFFVAACWAGGPILGFAPFLGAQPQEVQEFGSGKLTIRDAVRALVVLNTPVDVRPFGKDISAKTALVEIYKQLAAKKLDRSWVVDRHAMSMGRPDFDFHDARVNLSNLPRYAPVGMVLQEIFDQTKTSGILVIRPGFYEVTTRKAFLTRPRLGFFCWTMVAFAFTNTGDGEPDVLPAFLPGSTFTVADILKSSSVSGQQKSPDAHPLAKISKAWEADGFSTGWIQKMADRLKFRLPDDGVPAGLIPSFQLKDPDVGLDILSRLPRPTVPFGLDLWTHKWPDESLKHLAGLEKLDTLCVNASANSKTGIRHLAAIPNLRSLSITLDNATGATLQELAKINSLTTLVIRAEKIDGNIEHLTDMKQLRTLVIRSDKVPPGLAKFKNLTSLSLGGHVSTDTMREIAELKGLTELWICDAGLTDAQTKHLAGLHKLQFLNLTYNELTGPGLKDIAQLNSLRRLMLGNNKISDAGLEHLSGCKSLHDLDLQWNEITDAGMAHVGRITTLEKLNVYSNSSITERGKTELQKKLPKLRFYEPPFEKAA